MSNSTSKWIAPVSDDRPKRSGQARFIRSKEERDAFVTGQLGVNCPKPNPKVLTAASDTKGKGKEADTPFDAPQWNGAVELSKAFKGDKNKKTCLIKVGGTEFVLKGAPRGGDSESRADRSFAEDNAAAAKFISELKLTGVRAPAIRVLDTSEKKEVVAALQRIVDAKGANAKDAAELIQSLSTGDAQLSEPEEGGIDLDKIFLPPGVGEARDRVRSLRTEFAGDPDGAWGAAVKAGYGSNPKEEAKYLAATTMEARKNIANGLLQGFNEQRLEYARFLADIANGTEVEGLKAAEAEAKDRLAKQKQLRDFAGSRAGIKAYAGVAVADLIAGMDDRMIPKWNGGNFMFDPDRQELACIDNNKQQNKGLTEIASKGWENDLRNYFVNSDEDVAGVIFSAIFKPPESGNDNRPGEMPGFSLGDEGAARADVRAVLKDVLAKISKSKPDGTAAGERGAIIAELVDVQDLTSVPPALKCTGKIEDPSVLTKAGRGVQQVASKVAKKVAGKANWFADANEIKESLRNSPDQFRDIDKSFKKLIGNAGNLDRDSDRLAVHIRQLVVACEFADELGKRAAGLEALARNPPSPVGSPIRDTYAKLTARMINEANKWLENLKGGQKISDSIREGLARFEKASAAISKLVPVEGKST